MTGICISLLISFLGAPAASQVARSPSSAPRLTITAWSRTAGPDGATWFLQVKPDGSATVAEYSGPGKSSERRVFVVPPRVREVLVNVVNEADFFGLNAALGPQSVPLHGPENILEVTFNGRVHKMLLADPESSRGTAAERFRRVWHAVTATSSIKPPLDAR